VEEQRDNLLPLFRFFLSPWCGLVTLREYHPCSSPFVMAAAQLGFFLRLFECLFLRFFFGTLLLRFRFWAIVCSFFFCEDTCILRLSSLCLVLLHACTGVFLQTMCVVRSVCRACAPLPPFSFPRLFVGSPYPFLYDFWELPRKKRVYIYTPLFSFHVMQEEGGRFGPQHTHYILLSIYRCKTSLDH